MNINNFVYTSLSTLGVPALWNLRPKNFPSITYSFYNTFVEEYGDGEEMAEAVNMQVDIWSKGDYTELSKKVKKKLKADGWLIVNELDLYEEEKSIFHKVLRFNILIEKEEE